MVDCRPSDGIAIALRADAPITVEEGVVSLAGKKREELPDLQFHLLLALAAAGIDVEEVYAELGRRRRPR